MDYGSSAPKPLPQRRYGLPIAVDQQQPAARPQLLLDRRGMAAIAGGAVKVGLSGLRVKQSDSLGAQHRLMGWLILRVHGNILL